MSLLHKQIKVRSHLKFNDVDSHTFIYVIIGIVVFVLGSVMIIVLCIYWKRKKRNDMDHVRLKEIAVEDKTNVVELIVKQPMGIRKAKDSQLQEV